MRIGMDTTPMDLAAYGGAFLDRLQLPDPARAAFLSLLERVSGDAEHYAALLALCQRYMADPTGASEAVARDVRVLAAAVGCEPDTLLFVLLMVCSAPLADRYREEAISDEVYWDSMADLRYKALECQHIYGRWGTFVFDWFARFFDVTRFALGRLQFEIVPFSAPVLEKGPYAVHEGDPVLNIHIPSSGPLTAALCLDAYRRAHTFFTARFHTGTPSVFVCDSWLLYPDNAQFLPGNSRIREFMAPFTILERRGEEEVFADGWRVFGPAFRPPWDQLPQDTSLQRACAAWLMEGHRIGRGYGAFFFDGGQVL